MVSLRMSLPSIDQNGILVLIHGNDYACSSIDIISESDVPVSEKTKTENKNCNQIKQDSCNLYKIVLKVLARLFYMYKL